MNYINKLLRKSGSGEAAVQEPTPKKPLEDQTSLQASPESTPRRLTLESDQTTDYESACEGEDNPSNLSLLAEELKSVHISTPKTLAPLTKFPYSPPEKDLFINETFGPESFLDENNEKTENPFVKEKTVDPLSLVCDLNETSLCLDITLDQTIVAPEKTQIFDKSIKENLSPNLNHSLKKVNSKNLDGSILEEFYDSENFFGAEDELNSQKQSNLPSSTTKLNLSAKSEFSDVSYDDPNDSILKRPETSFSEKSVIKESPTKSVNQSENINISENSIEEPAEAEVKEKSNCIEPQLESAEEPLQLDAPKTEIENFKTDEKPPQEVNEAAETRTLDISESFEKKQEPFTFETLEAGDSSPAKAPQESSAPELCQKKEDGSDQKPVADEKPDVETAKITEEKFDQTVDGKNSEKLEETGETVGSLEDINGEIVEIAKEVLSDKLETTDVQPESKNEEIAVKINESGVENQEDKLLNENNKESQKVSVFEENSSDKTETNSFQEVIESLNNSNEETGEKIVQSVETPVNRASVENEFNKTAESGNLEEPRKSINQEDKEEVAVGSPESQKAVENEINKTVETEDLKPKKSIKQEEKAETEDFPASQKVGTPVENGISQIVASEDLKVPRKSITQENKKEVTEVLPASQKVATLVENGIDQTVACEDLKDSKKSIIQEDNKEETEVLPASQKVATPVENGISQIVASEDLQEPRKSIKQEEKAALTDDFSESHKVATPVENGINQTVDLKDPKKFINQEDKKEVTEVLPEVPSSVESNKIVNSEDLKEPRKSINDSVEAIESSERSIETTAFESECNETSIFKEPNKPAKRSNDSSTKSEELSIALGGSDFSNVFCDTISETFSPQACDLSSLQLKLDEKLTLSQALTDETILELKKDYTEEYFSITDAVNERAKLNGHPNNRILTVINEESFLISSSDTELFKSDSTSLASSIREDSLEPDLNPSREDSLEPSSLFGRTLNSMEKSYNSLQEIYETCSKQERELGCTDVVEPVLFNLSISAEAKRLADDFSKMDLTSETLKDVRPPQHMMHSVNSSEAGPVTADEDFKKTDKFCNATDFDFEAIDKLEKGDQNKTALPRNSIFLKFDPLFQHIQKEANQSMMSDHGDPEKTVIENKTPQKEQLRVNAVTPINREKRASLSPNAGTKTPGSDFLSKEIAKLQELMLQQEAAHQHVALESEEKSERIDQLKKRIAELESRDPNVGLEGKLKQLEAENAKLKKELSVTKTENKQLVNVMEEYEKTISQLMASKDEMQNQYEKDKEKIAMERDDAVSHLNNLEVAFSDVHLKYEKSKTIIEQLHNNEKLMNESLQEHVKVIAKKNANYEKLKLHATEKLAAANQEIANLTNSHKMEITKLNASNKRAEITIKSLEEALEQKKSEVLELTKICDELIGTDTSKN